VFLIPHFILGAIFLKTKLMIKLIVPTVTTIVSSVNFWLIAQTGFFDMVNSGILEFGVLLLPIVIIWEIAYQILVRVGNVS
jgi:hypothetical protein